MKRDDIPQFRGWFIPADIVDLFLDGELSPRELLLLTMIDGLVKSRGHGCYASNRTLGNKIGVGKQQINYLIAGLKKKGLIKQINSNERQRVLETVWSRIDNEGRSQKTDPPSVKRRTPCYTACNTNNLGEGGVLRSTVPPQGFIEDQDKPIDLDLLYAKQYKEQLHSQTKSITSWSPKKQSKEFAKLRRALKNDVLRLESVLKWYISNLHRSKQMKLPLCASPFQFRKRWDWIADRYDDSIEAKQEIKISDEAKAISVELKRRFWPKGSKEQIPIAVQMGIDSYKPVKLKLYNVGRACSDNGLSRAAAYLNGKLGSVNTFIKNWMEKINSRIQTWEDWGGDLTKLAFNKDSPEFERMCKSILSEYTNNKTHWTKLKDILDHANKEV